MLQTAAVVSKKLVVYSKITACVKQLCLLGVMHKVSNSWFHRGNTVSGKSVDFIVALVKVKNFQLTGGKPVGYLHSGLLRTNPASSLGGRGLN